MVSCARDEFWHEMYWKLRFEQRLYWKGSSAVTRSHRACSLKFLERLTSYHKMIEVIIQEGYSSLKVTLKKKLLKQHVF